MMSIISSMLGEEIASFLATAIVAFLVIIVVAHLMTRWKYRHIPGPFAPPFIGNVPTLMKYPWLGIHKMYKKYGSVFRLYVFNTPMVAVADPEIFKEILRTNHEVFHKDMWTYGYFKRILGKGLVTSQGEFWKKQKTMISPYFKFEMLEKLQPILMSAANRLKARWSETAAKKPLEIGEHFRQVTLEVISELALGLSPDKASVFPRLFVKSMDEMNHRVLAPYRKYFPVEAYKQTKRLDELDAIVQQLIATRKSRIRELQAEDKNLDAMKVAQRDGRAVDILDMLLTGNQDMDEGQLGDELKTMLLAGHETTSTMLTWTLYLLLTHPEVLAKAKAEVDAIYANGEPEFKDFKNLEYLDMVLSESLRLYTPVPVLTRYTVKDTHLGGKFVPKGTHLLMCVWSVHHSEEHFPERTEEFWPERFDRSHKRHPYSFAPFSLGPRECLGKNLARVEAKVILATLLRSYDMQMIDNHPEVVTDGFIIPTRPANGIWLNIKPRVLGEQKQTA